MSREFEPQGEPESTAEVLQGQISEVRHVRWNLDESIMKEDSFDWRTAYEYTQSMLINDRRESELRRDLAREKGDRQELEECAKFLDFSGPIVDALEAADVQPAQKYLVEKAKIKFKNIGNVESVGQLLRIDATVKGYQKMAHALGQYGSE